eukprot:TRINITY_DN11015_c0_g3_i2.p1 TRINITY_DN11015_c0_g3~~TRINITY_DN11015_c0_g3_i2.p1  ORF type:complete len:176 (+),score=51.54 TRINITY_DN11015_c0_g3_i2:61-528(+)
MCIRDRFFEELLLVNKKPLKPHLNVSFIGDKTEDKDMPKYVTEFFQLLSRELNKIENQMFMATPNGYLVMHSNAQKQKEAYFSVAGKLLGNSLLHKQRVGVRFSPSFVKLLYDETPGFDDLQYLVDEASLQNYKNLASVSSFSALRDLLSREKIR